MVIGKLPHRTDLLYELNRLVKKRAISAGVIQVIGALSRAHLSFYDQQKRAYRELSFEAPHEIVSGTGNISQRDGSPYVHLHLALADQTGRVVGGHCLEGCTIYAVEYVIFPMDGITPKRTFDETTGLYLWDKEYYDTSTD
jgi:uncharacterized protein